MKSKIKTRNALGGLMSGLLLLAVVVGQAQKAGATTVVTTQTAPVVGGNTAVDAGLFTKISSTDLLQGITPTSDKPELVGSFGQFSDGTGGEQDLNPGGRVIVGPNFGPLALWTITYSGLGGLNLLETRVFSYNADYRAAQNYDILFSTDSGFTFSTLITGVGSPALNGAELTIVKDSGGAFIATGVTDLRFVASNVPDGIGNFGHTAFVEIDALVPEPSTVTLAGVSGLMFLLWRRRGAAAH